MTSEQLRLYDPPDPEWKLGKTTRRVGLIGVRATQRVLERTKAKKKAA